MHSPVDEEISGYCLCLIRFCGCAWDALEYSRNFQSVIISEYAPENDLLEFENKDKAFKIVSDAIELYKKKFIDKFEKTS